METLTLNLNNRYTYADYLTWFDNKRRELIDGFISLMAGQVRKHQEVSIKLASRLFNFLENKKCKVYSAPFDVRLPKNEKTEDSKIYNVVQPDIFVVCDLNKLDEKGCMGAPDLIVEILSPSTSKRDLKDKFFLYEKSGVTEYWIAYPNEKTINKFVLSSKNNKYELKGMFVEDDTISPSMFPDLIMEITDIFDM